MRLKTPTWTIVCLLLPCGLGCQAVRDVLPDVPDVREARLDRKSDVTESFEVKRSKAEMQTARSHWRQGDPTACLDVVDGLLARDPKHIEALALRAEVQGAVEPVRHDVPLEGDLSERFAASTPIGVTRALATAPVERSSRRTSHRAGTDEESDSAGTDVDRAVERAQRALAAGDLAAARQNLQAALDADPENSQLATTLALLPLRYGQPDLAGQFASAAIARFGDSAALVRTQGIADYRRGDHASAARAFKRAIALDKHNPLTYRLAGHTLEKLGDSDAATWHHREARRLEEVVETQR